MVFGSSNVPAGPWADRALGPHRPRGRRIQGRRSASCRSACASSPPALDDVDNGFFDGPRLISYMQEPVAPAGSYAGRPGRWVADAAWPSPAVEPWTRSGRARAGADDGACRPRRGRRVRRPQTTGSTAACGAATAARRLRPRPAPRRRRLAVLGLRRRWRARRAARQGRGASSSSASTVRRRSRRPRVRRRARRHLDPDRPRSAQPQSPRGARPHRRRCRRRAGHRPRSAAVDGYAVPAGHRIRLAVSNSYWPWAWPVTRAGHPHGPLRRAQPAGAAPAHGRSVGRGTGAVRRTGDRHAAGNRDDDAAREGRPLGAARPGHRRDRGRVGLPGLGARS